MTLWETLNAPAAFPSSNVLFYSAARSNPPTPASPTPGGTIAADLIPMLLPGTSALRYGILSLSHKQVDQPQSTSWDDHKSPRSSLRLDPQQEGSRRKRGGTS